MASESTTIAIQRCLAGLAAPGATRLAESEERELLGRGARRMHVLCASLRYRSHPRRARPPVNLRATELPALRNTRPATVRQFFHFVTQHMRWELDDVARRLDQRMLPTAQPELVAAPMGEADAAIEPNAPRILEAIAGSPEDEREVLELVRLHGPSHPEAAEALGVSVCTVLAEGLGDLRPPPSRPGSHADAAP